MPEITKDEAETRIVETKKPATERQPLNNIRFLETVTDRDTQEEIQKVRALIPSEIIKSSPLLQGAKCIGNALFCDIGSTTRVIPGDKSAAFSSFLKEHFILDDWLTGPRAKTIIEGKLVRYDELFCHLRDTSERYALITDLPHHKTLPDVHYRNRSQVGVVIYGLGAKGN